MGAERGPQPCAVVVGITIGVGVGEPELLVESELDECAPMAGCRPSGMTMGVAAFASAPPADSELCDGGQSSEVGGHASALPVPDESPGGGHPAPAPKSPAPVQSAFATPLAPTVVKADTTTQAVSATTARRRAAGLGRVLIA